jgi:hypothetical protein
MAIRPRNRNRTATQRRATMEAAGQLILDIDGQRPGRPVAVRVNEIVALTYTSRDVANWWALYRLRGPTERFQIVDAGFIGDTVDVLCDDREHAEWLCAYLAEHGIPKAALNIATRPAA